MGRQHALLRTSFAHQEQQQVEGKMNKPSPLKQEIVRQGRIQADVALEAGISESRMSRIVNRRVTMKEHERRHLARVLGINIKESSDGHSIAQ
jgi:hypothetical protein